MNNIKMNKITYHGAVDMDGGVHYATLTVDDKLNKDDVVELMLEDARKNWGNIPNAYVRRIETDDQLEERCKSESQFKLNRPIMKKVIESKLSPEELKYIWFR